ncbi:MAG: macro domain-containing protein [Clostridia bacterium]|nr:macro domain-containing protein [Clostridia bacterium]
MPFRIIRNDLTRVETDAIVNTANPHPVVGEGTDRAVYMAAGFEELLNERKKIGDIPVGAAAVTSGFALPCRYIIHTVGPVWKGGDHGEVKALSSCYRESLKLAGNLSCSSIAFPLISTGYYGFPKDIALETASSVIYDFLMDNDMDIYLVVYDRDSFDTSEKYFKDITSYIDDNLIMTSDSVDNSMFLRDEIRSSGRAGKAGNGSISDHINRTEKTFQEHLLELIRIKDLKNSDIYHGANISKQHFSKMISNRDYHPSKNTACALAISLHLNLREAGILLAKAGYVLSRSSRFDLAVEYFLINRMYNIVNDNLILYDNGLELLGKQ